MHVLGAGMGAKGVMSRHTWQSKDNLWELFLFFYHVAPRGNRLSGLRASPFTVPPHWLPTFDYFLGGGKAHECTVEVRRSEGTKFSSFHHVDSRD